MAEPLTPRKQRIIDVLREEQEGLANDLYTGDILKRAFPGETRMSPWRRELSDLEWRRLIENVGLTRDGGWRITPAGIEAVS